MKFSAIVVLLLLSVVSKAKIQNAFSGDSVHRFGHYSTDREPGFWQDHGVSILQTVQMTKYFSMKAQVHAWIGDSYADLFQEADFAEARKEYSDIWPGDLYLQFAGGPVLFRMGYQQISWQEGFGFSYTNFINPRDGRVSVFEDTDMIYRSSPMANMILSADHLSAQAFYIPWSQHDIMAPFSRWRTSKDTPDLVPGQQVDVRYPTDQGMGDEAGGRLTWAGEGYDISAFTARLRDRQMVYLLSSLSTPTLLRLDGQQNYIMPSGVTGSASIGSLTIRGEYLNIPKREWNRWVLGNIEIYETGEQAFSLILDSTAIEKLTLSLQYSISILEKEFAGSVRAKEEGIAIASFQYDVTSDQILRGSALSATDGSFAGRLSWQWPASKRADLRLVYEESSGPKHSMGKTREDLNRAYLELTHHF